MKYLLKFNEDKSHPKIVEEFVKTEKDKKWNIKIVYNGIEDPDKDGFVIHITGYDYGIGNDIIGFFDFGTFDEATKPENAAKGLDIIKDKHKSPLTASWYYFNARDVVDFYKKCVLGMNIGMIEQYNNRINDFGFFITYD